jgi:hypothetical protein
MAKPCNYQLAGEDTWMSESDFKKRLNDGLLDRLLAENNIKIPGIKPLKESAPRAVEQTAPSSSVVAQEREATAVDARKSIPKQFNEGYVEVDGKEKGKVYKGYSIKVNEGNKTADIKLPNGKELKKQPILQIGEGSDAILTVAADGGTRINIPSQSELDAKAEKQRMIDEEKQAPEEKKGVRRKNIKRFEELESKDALKIAEMLKFSPNEFDGTEAINKEELGLFGFDEKITVNGRSYGTDKNKATSRIIEKLVDAKKISQKEGYILLEAFEAKKDAYWKAKNNAAKEKAKDNINKFTDGLRKQKGVRSSINPFDFLPDSLRNKAIDLFRDFLLKGADVSFAFRESVYNALISGINSGQITEEEGNKLEAEMFKQNTSDIEKKASETLVEAKAKEQTPDLRTQAKYRTDAQRKMTKELTKNRPKNNEELVLLARQFMNDGLINPKEDIVNPVISGERDLYLRPLNEVEQAVLRLYGRDLEDKITELNKKIIKATQDGKSPRVYDDEKAGLESDKLGYVDVMLDDSLITGRLFSFRRELESTRMTFDEMMVKAQSLAENSRGLLSDETKQKLKDIADKFAEVEKRVKEKEAEVLIEAEKEAVQNIIDDIDENGVDVEQETKTVKDKAKKIADNLRRNKIHRPGMFSVASPGSIAFDIAIEAAATAIETSGSVISAVAKALSAMKNTEWYKGLSNSEKTNADSELKEYIRGYSSEMVSSSDGKVKVPIALIRSLVARGVDTIEGLVEEVTKELEFTNPELIFTERQVRDAITGYGQFVRQPKSEISKKIAELKSVGRMISNLEDLRAKIAKAKDPVKKREFKDREIELKAQIRAMLNAMPISPEEEIAIEDNRLIDAKNRLRDKIYQLQQAKLQAQATGTRPDRRRRPASVSDSDIERLREEVAELQEEINQFPYSQEQLQEMEDKRLEQYKKRQRDMIKELQRKLRDKDFSKKKPKSLELDEEATQLRNERQRLRDEYDAELEAIDLKNRSIGMKIFEGFISGVNEVKSLALSADISVFRQAGFIMADLIFSDPKTVGRFMQRAFTLAGLVPSSNPVTNPAKFGKELVNSLFEADNGKKLYEAIDLERKQSGDYQLMKDSGLFLQEETASIRKKEEAHTAGYVKKIPLIGEPIKIRGRKILPGLDLFGRGERSFSSLNELRVSVFMQGVRRLREAGVSFKDNPDAYKAWARHVNTMSGRGTGGNHWVGRAFEAMAPILNVPLVSARFLKSRFDLAALNPYSWIKLGMLPVPVRALAYRQMFAANAYMAATTYVSYLVLGATLAALPNFGDDDEEEVELTEEEDENVWKLTMDFISSDFMKFTNGDVSLDFLAGFSQADVFIARMFSQSKTVDGEIVEFNSKYNGPTWFNVPLNFLTSKMNPWAQYLVKKGTEISKKNEGEEGVTEEPAKNESEMKIQDYFLPLPVRLLRDLAKQKNLSTREKITLNALSFTGIGNVNVSTFGKKEEEVKKDKSGIFGGGSSDPFEGGGSDPFGGGSNDPFK